MTITRRQFSLAAPSLLSSVLAASGCSLPSGADDYDSAVAQTWRPEPSANLEGAALSRELVRYATLAPSSHNTQCWKFKVSATAITIFADLSRRCPAVDPDDHHVFVSLGCATENLVQAARALGKSAEVRFDPQRSDIQISLQPARAQASDLFQAIPLRQCTRGDYDGATISNADLNLLKRAGTSSGVQMLLLTERAVINQLRDYVVEANTRQMADPAFVRELKTWIRFNEAAAVHTRDGLFTAASGNPSIPTWIGDLAFGMVFTSQSENEKYVRQIDSSAGIAVFVGQVADPAHWVEVGRCYERFALQATALGIRNAFLNQPLEVASVRPPLAAALGVGEQRPDLVVRFGRGPVLPRSLRRPVNAVLTT